MALVIAFAFLSGLITLAACAPSSQQGEAGVQQSKPNGCWMVESETFSYERQASSDAEEDGSDQEDASSTHGAFQLSFDRDSAGRVVTCDYYPTSGGTYGGFTWSIEYDGDTVAHVFDPDVAAASYGEIDEGDPTYVMLYTRDSAGRVVRVEQASNVEQRSSITEYAYDAQGRIRAARNIVRAERVDGSSANDETGVYLFDEEGNTVYADQGGELNELFGGGTVLSDAVSAMTEERDAEGRPLTLYLTAGGYKAALATYDFDEEGNLLAVNRNLAMAVAVDSSGEPVSADDALEFTQRLASASQYCTPTLYSCDSEGNVSVWTRENQTAQLTYAWVEEPDAFAAALAQLKTARTVAGLLLSAN